MNHTYAFISNDIKWGTAPSWAAFIVATIAAGLAYGAFRREQRRDRVNAEIRLREQAAKVAAWWDTKGEDFGYFVVLKNASELPVEGVTVAALHSRPVDASGRKIVQRVPIRPEQSGSALNLDSREFAVIPPGESETFELDIDMHEGREVFIDLTFRDAQGIEWKRSRGKLTANDEKTQPIWFRAFNADSALTGKHLLVLVLSVAAVSAVAQILTFVI